MKQTWISKAKKFVPRNASNWHDKWKIEVKGDKMSLENNIKCDYENCQQRYLAEPHNWWIVDKNEDADNLSVEMRPLSGAEYEQIVDGQRLENETHCCCIDHAVKQAARFCEELMTQKNTAVVPGAAGAV